jgi:hypothetical protein
MSTEARSCMGLALIASVISFGAYVFRRLDLTAAWTAHVSGGGVPYDLYMVAGAFMYLGGGAAVILWVMTIARIFLSRA